MSEEQNKEKKCCCKCTAIIAIIALLMSVASLTLSILNVDGLFKNKKLNTLKPLILGGGQEGGLRSGTENVFGIKVFEYATTFHNLQLKNDYERVSALKSTFLNGIDKNLFKIISSENSSPYVICLSAIGLRGEVIQHMLEQNEIIIGTGSACSSKHRHSRMLKSIGYSDEVLDGVIRISFSPYNTIDEVVFSANIINNQVLKLTKAIKR